jgi:hypothetical protein
MMRLTKKSRLVAPHSIDNRPTASKAKGGCRIIVKIRSRKNICLDKRSYTTLSAQLELAKASGFALKTKPMPMI